MDPEIKVVSRSEVSQLHFSCNIYMLLALKIEKYGVDTIFESDISTAVIEVRPIIYIELLKYNPI